MKRNYLLFLIALQVFFSCTKNDKTAESVNVVPVISTIAGIGPSVTFSGDGGPATAAQLYLNKHVATDGEGNIYIADCGNKCIRKVNTAGIITTVAGTPGVLGFTADGAQATNVKFNFLEGITVDNAGNLYVLANYLLRKIDKNTGIISTVAGDGVWSCCNNNGDGLSARQCTLNLPQGVAIDGSGNIYIADWASHKIRKVNAATGIINTIAGGKGFSAPLGDNGLAINARAIYPSSVVVDKDGNVYFESEARIRKINTNGIITTIAGTGEHLFNGDSLPAINSNIWPTDIAIDNKGNLYIGDDGNSLVRKVDNAGLMTVAAGYSGYNIYKTGDGGPARLSNLGYPTGVATDQKGNVYIADYGSCRVRKITY